MKTRAIQSSPYLHSSETITPLIDDGTVLEAVDRVLAGIEDLHSAPPVVQKILEITRRIDFDIKELSDAILCDPALCAKILRLVNSASYGLPREINGIRQAITILGQRTLRLLVMTFSIVDKLTKGVAGEMYGAYWRTALTSAVVASKLSQSRKRVDVDQAYSTGLLADLGVLVLAQARPDEYPSLFLSRQHDEFLLTAEQAAFGCNHAQIGAALLQRWGFSAECCSAILHHHDLQPCGTDLELVVMAASMTAEMLWSPTDDLVANARSILRSELDCDTDKLITLVLQCKDEISRQAELFGVEKCDRLDAASLLEQARKLFVNASLQTAMDFDTAVAMFEQTVTPPTRRR